METASDALAQSAAKETTLMKLGLRLDPMLTIPKNRGILSLTEKQSTGQCNRRGFLFPGFKPNINADLPRFSAKKGRVVTRTPAYLGR